MSTHAELAKVSRRGETLVGKTNKYGLLFSSGPYKEHGKHKNMTAWGLMCNVCNEEFITSTNIALNAKTCYGCRYSLKKSYSQESTWKHLYSGVKGRRNAKRYGFSLSLDEFIDISQRPCEYCGFDGYVVKGHREWSAFVKANGLDRVDSHDGYHLNNVVPCCRVCNVAKSYMSRKEFLAWVQRIAKYNNL